MVMKNQNEKQVEEYTHFLTKTFLDRGNKFLCFTNRQFYFILIIWPILLSPIILISFYFYDVNSEAKHQKAERFYEYEKELLTNEQIRLAELSMNEEYLHLIDSLSNYNDTILEFNYSDTLFTK